MDSITALGICASCFSQMVNLCDYLEYVVSAPNLKICTKGIEEKDPLKLLMICNFPQEIHNQCHRSWKEVVYQISR